MAKVSNLTATYEAVAGDQFCVTVCWEEVPNAAYYTLYRDLDCIQIDPPFDYKTINGTKMVCYRDTEAWNGGQHLDLFYWVSATEDVAGVLVEGELSDSITNVHPYGLRVIEITRASLGDDLRIFNDQTAKVGEQISIYNYKLAMDRAKSAINATPTKSAYGYGNFPEIWTDLLVQGTIVKVLPKLILLEQAKQHKMDDQGQSWTPPELAAALKDFLTMEEKAFNEYRKEIKHNERPAPRAVGSLRALFVSPQMHQWRHVAVGRNFFGFLVPILAGPLLVSMLSLLIGSNVLA